MTQKRRWIVLAVFGAAAVLVAVLGWILLRNGQLGPEETLKKYLDLQAQYRFEEAYDYASNEMRDNKSREDWSADYRDIFEGGKVEVISTTVYPAKIENGTALVPNILRAKDIFNKEGSTEYEIYTLVKEDDRWKVHRQQLLSDEEEIRRWFGDVEIGGAVP